MNVGDKARRSKRVSARDIELFTELTGDRNPLHYDAAAAERSTFGGIIVQGGVTSGLLNAVVAEDLATATSLTCDKQDGGALYKSVAGWRAGHAGTRQRRAVLPRQRHGGGHHRRPAARPYEFRDGAWCVVY